MCAISYYSMLRSGTVTCRQLINAKDYPNIIRYYSLFEYMTPSSPLPPSPQTIHISQSVFEQILPLVPEENKADVCAGQCLLSPS